MLRRRAEGPSELDEPQREREGSLSSKRGVQWAGGTQLLSSPATSQALTSTSTLAMPTALEDKYHRHAHLTVRTVRLTGQTAIPKPHSRD